MSAGIHGSVTNRKSRQITHVLALAVAAAGMGLGRSANAQALPGGTIPSTVPGDLISRANNTADLNDPAGWNNPNNPGFAPGPNDVAVWDFQTSVQGAYDISAPVSWFGITVINPVGAAGTGNPTIFAFNNDGPSNTISLGGGGIQTINAFGGLQFAINAPIVLTADQEWDAQANRNILINGGATGNFNVTNRLAGTLTFSAPTTFGNFDNHGGNINENFFSGANATNVGTLFATQDLLNPASTLSVGGVNWVLQTSNSGNVSTYTQHLAGLIITGGQGFYQRSGNPASGTNNGYGITVVNSNIGRTIGGFMDMPFTTQPNGTSSALIQPYVPSTLIALSAAQAAIQPVGLINDQTNGTNGAPGLTFGLSDWAGYTNDTRFTSATIHNLARLHDFDTVSSVTAAGFIGYNPDWPSPTVSALTSSTLTSNVTIGSFRDITNQSTTLNLGGNTLTIGGILIGGGKGTSFGYQLLNGVLRGVGTDLVVLTQNANSTIGANIVDGPVGATTFSKNGTGTVVLTGVNTYTGATYSTSTTGGPVGGFVLSSNDQLGPTAVNATLTLDGGGIIIKNDLTIPRNIVLGTRGGGGFIDTGDPGDALVNSTLSGNNVGHVLTLSGNISGDGILFKALNNQPTTFGNGANQNNNKQGIAAYPGGNTGTLVLTGTNSTYTGQIQHSSGVLLFMNTAGNSGGLNAIAFQNGVAGGGSSTVGGIGIISTILQGPNSVHIFPGVPGVVGGVQGLPGAMTAPGATVGTLTVGGVIMPALANTGVGAQWDFLFSSSTSTSSPHSMIVTTNADTSTINGGYINLVNVATSAASYHLIQMAGFPQGSGVGSLRNGNPIAGDKIAFTLSGGFIDVSVFPVLSASWAVDLSGSWSTSSNWTSNPSIPGFGANTIGSGATFGPVITANRTVSLNGGKQLSDIVFNSTNSYNIAVGSSGSIVLDMGTINSQTATVILGTPNSSVSQSHTISAPIQLNSTAQFGASSTLNHATLTLATSAPVTGNPGTLTLVSPLLPGSNSLNNFTMVLQSTLSAQSVIGAGTTLQVGNNDANGNLTNTITNNGLIVFKRSGTNVTQGVGNAWLQAITGGGGVIYAGNNNTQMGQLNSYTGGTGILSGTVTLAGGTTLHGNGSQFYMNGGKVDLNGQNFTASSLSSSLGNPVGTFTGTGTIGGFATTPIIDNVSAGGSVFINETGGTASTFAGQIKNTTGTVGILKTGGSSLTLIGTANTFTGTVVINAGQVVVGTNSALGTASLVDIGAGGAIAVAPGMNSLQTAPISLRTNGEFTDGQTASAATLSNNVSFNTTLGASNATYRLGVGGTTSGTTTTLTLAGTHTIPTSVTAATGGTDAIVGTVLSRGNLIWGTGSALNSLVPVGVGGFAIGNQTGVANVTFTGTSQLNASSTTGAGTLAIELGAGNGTASANAVVANMTISGNSLVTAGVSGNQAFDLQGDAGTNFITTSLTLLGGSLTLSGFLKSHISAGTGTNGTQTSLSTLNLQGGTIRAGASNASFLPAATGLTVKVAGATATTFDTNGFNDTVGAALTHDAAGPATDGGINKNGTGVLTITGAASYNGPTTINGGTLEFSNASVVTHNIGTIAGAGNLTVVTGPGTTVLQSAGVSIGGTWTIQAGATHQIKLGSGNAGTSKVNAVPTIPLGAGGGQLDLTDNRFIVQSTGGGDKTAKIAAVNADLIAASGGSPSTGYGLAWGGKGITSSTIVAPLAYGIGVWDNAVSAVQAGASLGGVYGGKAVDSNSILVHIAHIGDADGNGIVNIIDLSIVANAWQQPGNNWAVGDLNGDGIANIIDFTMVANNWQQTTAFPLTAADYSSGLSAPSFGGGAASVPEPTSLALLAAGGAALLARRRRR